MDYSRIFIAFGILLSLTYCSLSSLTENELKECKALKIVIHLYTKKNPIVPKKLELSSDMKNAILQSTFDPQKENKILIHGFQGSATDLEFQSIKTEYLKKEYNVWIFDWSNMAAGPPIFYRTVVRNMEDSGKCISYFVKEIINVTQAGENALHFIGHSLGVHMAGYIASYIENYKIARITGLDPASPLFKNGQEKNRVLSKYDAKFVDILHTSNQILGKTDAIGHADFYLNGGFNQPRCKQFDEPCNHRSVLIYFAESINSTIGFYGYACPSLEHYMPNKCPPEIPHTLMGEPVKTNTTGIFIVMTNGSPPYAKGEKL